HLFSSIQQSISYCAPFFFKDTATTKIYTLSLHDALPILEHLACREGRLAGSEEDDCVGDLLGVAETLERNTGDEAGLSFRGAGEAIEHCGLDRPRRNRVDPYA